jgi:hypothetical protein
MDLNEWGLDTWQPSDVNLDQFFEENNETKDGKFKIVLEYNEDDYNVLMDLFARHSGSKENIVFELLKK